MNSLPFLGVEILEDSPGANDFLALSFDRPSGRDDVEVQPSFDLGDWVENAFLFEKRKTRKEQYRRSA